MDANEHYAAGEHILREASKQLSGDFKTDLIGIAQAHFLAAATARLTDLVGAVEPIRVTLQQTRGR
jgi:hypothetical protein